MAGVLYNKFLVWAVGRNRNGTESDFLEYIRTVYQLEDPETNGIMDLLSTFIAQSVEDSSNKKFLYDTTCSASSSRKKRSFKVETCPASWLSYKGMCFKYFPTKTTWPEAKASCNKQKAHLSYLASTDLNSIRKDLKIEGSRWYVWVGGVKKNDVWWWEDESPIASLDLAYANQQLDPEATCLMWSTGKHSPLGMVMNQCNPSDKEKQKTYICQMDPNGDNRVSPVHIHENIQNLMYSCHKKITQTAILEETLPLVDIFFNPEKTAIKDEMVLDHQTTASQYFTKERMQSVFPDLFRLLWHSRLPCFSQPSVSTTSLVRRCEVAGVRLDCSTLFTKVPTDTGLCCALNSKVLLKDGSEFSRLVREMQKKDNPKISDRVAAGVGMKKGVKLLLDLHSNFESLGSVPDFFKAFQVFVGHPAEYPIFKQQSVMVKPGHETSLDLTATVLTASPAILSINPSDRNCYFKHEVDKAGLELYQTYSYKSCIFECQIMYVALCRKDFDLSKF